MKPQGIEMAGSPSTENAYVKYERCMPAQWSTVDLERVGLFDGKGGTAAVGVIRRRDPARNSRTRFH